MSHGTLDRSDAEVFYANRLDDPAAGQFYRDRVERLKDENVFIVEPRLFRAWGPPLVALIHPWKLVGESRGPWERSPEDPRVFVARLATEKIHRRRVSIVFRPPGRTRIAQLLIGDQPLQHIRFRGSRRLRLATTNRFKAAPEVLMRLTKAPRREPIPFTLRVWRQARRHRSGSKKP
jgi:hypothetical protein